MEAQRRVGMFRESPGSDIVKQGYLKKLKTMRKKYFVLRSTSSSGPARLDYFDSEKKFKSSHPPKKSYHLYTLFNINKKIDSKHKFVIAIFLPTEVFSVIAESVEEQENWIDKLLEFQNEYLPQDVEPRIHYDYVWQGVVKHKSPTSISQITGQYRFCLSEKAVSLVKLSEYTSSFQFQFSSIRKCGAHEHFFLMEVGRSTVTGCGDIWLEVESSSAAQAMHDVIFAEMKASRSADDPFRRRSNTGSGASHRGGGDTHTRRRATSESTHHHPHGSPHRVRSQYAQQRPQSTVVYSQRPAMLGVEDQIQLGSSPSAFDPHQLEGMRDRAYSAGSRTSRHSDMLDHSSNPSTPIMSPEGSFILSTPDAPFSITEEDGELSDSIEGTSSDYLSMDPSHRSMTPSPTRSQGHSHFEDHGERSKERIALTHGKAEMFDNYLSMTPGKSEKDDYLSMTPGGKSESNDAYLAMSPGDKSDSQGAYLAMTPGQRSGTPSPTRLSDRPGSSGSQSRESSRDRGYMDMRPGSAASSPASSHDASYMNLTPPKSGSPYMDMNTPSAEANNSYIDMNPGQRTPADPGPGYVLMDGAWVRTSTVPIPIRAGKEAGYMDMGTHGPSNQPLPTVKESGSGEAYLPMSPTGQCLSSEGLKPAKVFSYLSDDSMSGEFPKRAYSVGSRPVSKSALRYQQQQQHQHQESLRRQQLDNSMSSSAPHLMVQKTRPIVDVLHHKGLHPENSYVSPLSTSVRSDDSDSFVEMDFYRPRTASDSYGCRPRSSSFGKQFIQGHRPRSSSYGQGGKPGMSKLAAGLRTDSYESVRTTSQELSSRQRSQESLGLMSSSSRNSSNESLKKHSESSHARKGLGPGEYMDMSYEKNKTTSQGSLGVLSPKKEAAGYMDMTVGTSTPKSLPHGISPCSSTHSLSASSSHTLGSSPGGLSLGHSSSVDKTRQGAKVIKPSGKVASQKPGVKSAPQSSATDNQLKVLVRVKKVDKRSPSGSGRESEDESYVPFQPSVTSPSVSQEEMMSKLHGQASFEHHPKAHPGLKIQHGHSRSYDSGMRSPESAASNIDTHSDTFLAKVKRDEKLVTKCDEDVQHKSKMKNDKNRMSSEKDKKGGLKKSPKAERAKNKGRKDSSIESDAVAELKSPVIEEKLEFIPDDDLFSNKVFSGDADDMNKSSPEEMETKTDESGYLEYCPGLEASLPKTQSKNEKPDVVKLPVHMKDFVPKHFVEREYCEIDFPDNNKSKVSDYVDSDPAPLKEFTEDADLKNKASASSGTKPEATTSLFIENKVVDSIKERDLKEMPSEVEKLTRKGSKHTDDFSYMDFDPAVEKPTGSEVEEGKTVKAPHRVLSFIAHSNLTEETDTDSIILHQEASQDTKGCEDSRPSIRKGSSSSNKSEKATSVESRNRLKSRENSGDKNEESAKLQDNESIRKGSCSNCQVGKETELISYCHREAKLVSEDTRENEAKGVKPFEMEGSGVVADSGCKVHSQKDRHLGKLVIKQIHLSNSESQPVQDEGYCDLDLSDIVPPKGHKRSGSTSSSNSDRSRKVFESEDSMPCPETPISYISEESDDIPVPETPLSYISDDSSGSVSSIKDAGSPFKSALGARVPNPTANKMSGFGFTSLGVSAENLRKSFPTPRQQGGAQNLVGGALSRQSSVPVGPAIGSRNSADMQQHVYRTRKSSGPASLSSQPKNGSSASSTPVHAPVSSLEPVIAGQELHKQKSMPCMNLPVNIDKTANPESMDHSQSRHSFTDLSQYEVMNFPADKFKSGNQQKCSSQQQLNTESNELHYADLDLNGSSENMDGTSPRVVKSRNPSSLDDVSKVQYAEIDHLKTEKMKSEKDVKFYVN